MAHKIDHSKGGNAFVAYKKSAWHGLGTTINEAVTVKHALELGGMDYKVVKKPNVHMFDPTICPTTGKEIMNFIESEKSFFTYRTDTNTVLGASVGKVYNVIQNVEALDIVDDVMKTNPNILIETAGVLDSGRLAFITLKMPEPTAVTKGDDFYSYILIVNSFDGTTPIMCLYTNIRVVCWNTCSAAMNGKNKMYSYVIKHTTTAKDRMQEAVKVLAKQRDIVKMSAETFRKMYGTKLTKDEQRDFAFNVMLEHTEILDVRKGKPLDEIVSTRKMNMISGILEFTESGVGQSTINGTAWGAYNGTTGFFTNVRAYSDAGDRFKNMMLGTSNEYMCKAFHLAANPKDIIPIRPLSTSFSMSDN